MTSLIDTFAPLCSEVEREIKKALSGILTGVFIRGYLPQNWIFKTENETITFSVSSTGDTSVMTGASDSPDVTIEIDHDYLVSAIQNRSQPSFKPQRFEISLHTPKGKTAFNYLRDRFGL